EERRHIFEEAAGIQKYKSRRRETQTKLRNTEQDLLRIGDVVSEIEKVVRSLKRQVNRAKRYQKFRERMSVAEVHLGLLRDRRFDDEMKPLREELRNLRESREGLGSGLAEKEAAVEEARAHALDLEKGLADLQRKVDQAREQARQVESNLIALRERCTAAEEAARRGHSDAEELENKRIAAIEERERLGEEKIGVAEELKQLKEQEATLGESLQEIETRLDAARGELEEIRDRHNRASVFYQDEAQRAEFLRYKVKERRERIETLGAQQARTIVDAEEAERDKSRLVTQVEEIRQKVAGIRLERDDVERSREEKTEELQSETRLLADIEGSLQASRAERDVVRGLLDRLEGVGDAVKDLREDDDEGFGVLLAEVLQLDDAAVPVAEAVLGPTLEGILLADEEALTRAIDRLSQREQGGRAVLLAPHISGDGSTDAPAWIEGVPGFRGRLSDLVRGEGSEAMVARGLLSRVLWMETLADALAVAGESGRDGWTLVTTAGEVLVAGKLASGPASGLLSRRQKLTELDERVQSLTSTLADAERGLQRRKEDLAGLKERGVSLADQLDVAENELRETGWAHNEASSNQKTLREKEGDLRARVRDEEAELSEDITELEKLSPMLSKALEESGELGGAVEAHQLKVAEVGTEQDGHRHHLQESRLNRVRSEHRLDGLDREMVRLASNALELGETAERRLREAKEAEENHRSLSTTIVEQNDVFTDRQQVRHALEEELGECEKAFLEHRNSMQEIEDGLRKERRAREDRQERAHAVELRLSELDLRRQNLADRIKEDYDIDLGRVEESELLQEGEEAPSYEDLEAEVAELRDRLEKLGPVNLLALEEYEAESERLEFLVTQRDDLVEAQKTLQQTIRKINKTARKRFVEVFELVRTNFQSTYVQFFEGGEADIYLTEDLDPLEANIEIVARPRGKILKNMAALSGGEKALTAIALLFAIYLVKPSPFCILDEVDAPLDEANIGRFLRVLAHFQDTTQFILITHNTRTMEASDSFLGITMEEPGVSKVVGVRFEEEAAA
ncbi:chromosome segregation protein SMC, partial [Gemmatimonadota bacterium]